MVTKLWNSLSYCGFNNIPWTYWWIKAVRYQMVTISLLFQSLSCLWCWWLQKLVSLLMCRYSNNWLWHVGWMHLLCLTNRGLETVQHFHSPFSHLKQDFRAFQTVLGRGSQESDAQGNRSSWSSRNALDQTVCWFISKHTLHTTFCLNSQIMLYFIHRIPVSWMKAGSFR